MSEHWHICSRAVILLSNVSGLKSVLTVTSQRMLDLCLQRVAEVSCREAHMSLLCCLTCSEPGKDAVGMWVREILNSTRQVSESFSQPETQKCRKSSIGGQNRSPPPTP